MQLEAPDELDPIEEEARHAFRRALTLLHDPLALSIRERLRAFAIPRPATPDDLRVAAGHLFILAEELQRALPSLEEREPTPGASLRADRIARGLSSLASRLGWLAENPRQQGPRAGALTSHVHVPGEPAERGGPRT